MGRVITNQTTAAPSPIKHFSHPHDLHPIPSNNPQNTNALCSACKLQSTGMMYTCPPCNFVLHQSCAKLPQLITHPAHGGCNLSLLTISSYPGGQFSCDACSCRGDGWSYNCSRCHYDLHVRCSIKPLKIRHQVHPCDLKLTFHNPYAGSSGLSCDICRRIGEKQWVYRCDSCKFDVHMDCSASQPQILQHHHSLPRPNTSHHQIQTLHSASTGGIPGHHVFNQFQGPVMNPGGFNVSVPSNPHLMQNNQPAMGGGFVSNLLTAAAEGAMQQVAQTAVQDVISFDDGFSSDVISFDDGFSY